MDDRIELLWDMVLTTDRAVGSNRPDIVIRDEQEKKVYIIDISCPSDGNVKPKENEKITKYSGMRVELSKMWNSECIVIPIVVGGLAGVSHDFRNYLKIVPGDLSIAMCLKITVLGSEKIMRSFLSSR